MPRYILHYYRSTLLAEPPNGAMSGYNLRRNSHVLQPMKLPSFSDSDDDDDSLLYFDWRNPNVRLQRRSKNPPPPRDLNFSQDGDPDFSSDESSDLDAPISSLQTTEGRTGEVSGSGRGKPNNPDQVAGPLSSRTRWLAGLNRLVQYFLVEFLLGGGLRGLLLLLWFYFAQVEHNATI